MVTLPESTIEIISYLKLCNIDPILYGSQGVSLYLGAFKTFSDVDLLIDGKLLEDEWSKLQKIMTAHDFSLVDEHEHEFKNSSGVSVNFGSEKILVRDNIMDSLAGVVHFELEGAMIKTLSPDDFKKAYEFSVKDGYRIETRGKKDDSIIALLEDYLHEKALR